MANPAHGGGHGHAGHMPSSGRAMTIAAWLTGIFFVTLQVESVCLDESGAEAIDVTRTAADTS